MGLHIANSIKVLCNHTNNFLKNIQKKTPFKKSTKLEKCLRRHFLNPNKRYYVKWQKVSKAYSEACHKNWYSEWFASHCMFFCISVYLDMYLSMYFSVNFSVHFSAYFSMFHYFCKATKITFYALFMF